MRDVAILRSRNESIDPTSCPSGASSNGSKGSWQLSTAVLTASSSAEARARFDFDFRSRSTPWPGWASANLCPPNGLSSTSRLIHGSSKVGWSAPAEDEALPDDVVKQVSFLHGTEGYSLDAFLDHYRVGVANKNMPALWQYIQNDVEAIVADARGRGARDLELGFRTTDDFVNRYFPSEADQRAFSAHEDFLDLRFATSFVCASARGRRRRSG